MSAPKNPGKNENSRKRELARSLFMAYPDRTQKELADQVDVTPGTLRRWIAEGNWENDRNLEQVTIEAIRKLGMEISSISFQQMKEDLKAGKRVDSKMADTLRKIVKSLDDVLGRETLAGHITHGKRFMLFLKISGEPELLELAQRLVDMKVYDRFFDQMSKELHG